MHLYELEESLEVIKHINGLLLMFSTTAKTNKILIEYLQQLILELQDQGLIDEASEKTGEDINFEDQISFIKHILSILEEKEFTKEIIDKSAN